MKKFIFENLDFFFERYSNHKNNLKLRKLFNELKAIGENCNFPSEFICKNPQYISIGDNFSALRNLRLEAWDHYVGENYNPKLLIGNNVSFNTDVHIGCINEIVIGDNVLMASRIYISDHSHGEINREALTVSPAQRKLYSKGPVIIEGNVWIGEGVCILAGVTIGENSIIGANAVVTANIPKNAIVGGIPARVLKTL